ncbi:MAG TPA: hypothetical protein VFB67_13855, partial [Candidatus Polarisedimenticolaceae bacterium]|nr:hypothetical protein [Candidatus Polarisedimenticolaceae bacterium]
MIGWLFSHPFQFAFGVAGTVFALALLFTWIRFIPNTRIGIVEKLVSGKGSVKSGLIALDGEAGF